MIVSSPVSTRHSPPVSDSEKPLRLAGLEDLQKLLELEALCFDPVRRDSPLTVRRSLGNPRHEVWVLDGPGGRLNAALFLRPERKALRIYSVASHPSLRGQGMGNLLLDWAISRGLERGVCRLVLEADAANPDLVGWYERHAFQRSRLLGSFYAPGRDAWRLERELHPSLRAS